MARRLDLLAVVAALALAPATHAQTREIGRAGLWHIQASDGDCTALYKYPDTDILVALIYPQPGKNPNAALMITSDKLFSDAKDRAPYPARLVLTDDAAFDTSWHAVVPTGITLRDTTHGIRIAAPAEAFGDSLAKAEALRLEGIGRGTVALNVGDMQVMIDALRKCVAPGQ
jgi:hypothetical protein